LPEAAFIIAAAEEEPIGTATTNRKLETGNGKRETGKRKTEGTVFSMPSNFPSKNRITAYIPQRYTVITSMRQKFSTDVYHSIRLIRPLMFAICRNEF